MSNPSDKPIFAHTGEGDLSFEQGLKELEAIVTQMEEGRVSLEEAVSLYERGVALQKRCSQQLEGARLRIEKLSLTPEGEIVQEPFEAPSSS